MKLPTVLAVTGAGIGAITAWNVGNDWHDLGGGTIAVLGAVIVGVSAIVCWCAGNWVARRCLGFSLKTVMETETFEAAGLGKLTRRELRTLSGWFVIFIEDVSARAADPDTRDDDSQSIVLRAAGAAAGGGLASTVGGAGLAIAGGAVAIPPIAIIGAAALAGWGLAGLIGSLFADDDEILDIEDLMDPELLEATGLEKLSAQECSTFNKWLTYVINRTIEEAHTAVASDSSRP